MSERVLIDELIHNVEASGNRILERRLADLAVWYYQNKGGIARDNLAGRQAFLEKAFWIMLEVMALQTSRIQKLEGRASNLWLPSGMSLNGNAHFG